MGMDSGFEAPLSAAVSAATRRAWVGWIVRLVIGVTLVAVAIARRPEMWWVALIYAPFPLFSAVKLRRLRSRVRP